jgi:glycosyltransferase involved in cell wall biosynthesis
LKTILIAHNYSEKSFASMSYHLANDLAENNYRVVFMSHRPYFGKPKIVKKNKGEIILISWITRGRPTGIRNLFWFSKIYLKYKPSLVIGHFASSNITILVSKILSFGKVKTFEYYHTISDLSKLTSKQKLLLWRKKFFYKLFCDVIICPSILAQNDLKKHFNVSKSKVILNAISDRFVENQNQNSEPIVISYLGRLEKSKGIIDLIIAFKKYKETNENSNLILNIAGSGNEEIEIKKLIENVPEIVFYGFLNYDKIDEFINRGNYTIIPSTIDNLPTVGIESLMLQIPLLISNTIGLSDYLSDGFDCLKFDPNIDSIIKVFEKIDFFNSKNILSTNARKTYLKLFQPTVYIDSMILLFRCTQ